MYVYVYMYILVCMHAHINMCVYTYIRTHVWLYVYVYEYVCVYIYTHIHARTHSQSLAGSGSQIYDKIHRECYYSKIYRFNNLDSSVSRGTNQNKKNGPVWICTKESHFLDLVDFRCVAFTVNLSRRRNGCVCVAVPCSEVQCVAVCCSVPQKYRDIRTRHQRRSETERWISLVTHMDMSHMWESCRRYKYVMLHMWVSHVTGMNE